MKRNNFTQIIISSLIISTCFCLFGFTSHKLSFCEIPISEVIQLPNEQTGITIHSKILTGAESKKYLHRNLPARGVQPLYLVIQNNSNKTYTLSEEGVNLPLISSSKITNKLAKGAIARSIGFKVAGFFFWPLVIPETIDGIISLRSQLNIRRDFDAKSIKSYDEQIPAYSTVNRLLFIKSKHFQPEFTIFLKDQDSKEFQQFTTQVK